MRQHRCGVSYTAQQEYKKAIAETKATTSVASGESDQPTPLFDGVVPATNAYADVERFLADVMGVNLLSPLHASDIFNRERCEGHTLSLQVLMKTIHANWQKASEKPCRLVPAPTKQALRQAQINVMMTHLYQVAGVVMPEVTAAVGENFIEDNVFCGVPSAIVGIQDAAELGGHRTLDVLQHIHVALQCNHPYHFGQPEAQEAAMKKSYEIVVNAFDTKLPPRAEGDAPLTYEQMMLGVAIEKISNVLEMSHYGVLSADGLSRTSPLRITGALLTELGIPHRMGVEIPTIEAESVAGVQMREMHETFRAVHESLKAGVLRQEVDQRYAAQTAAPAPKHALYLRAQQPNPTQVSNEMFKGALATIKPLFAEILDTMARQIRAYDGFAPEVTQAVAYQAPLNVLTHLH